MPRVCPRVCPVARTPPARYVYGEIRESGARGQDPDRLPAQQPDEHVDCRLLDACEARGAGVGAARVERACRWSVAGSIHDSHSARTARTAAVGSVEGVLADT